MSYQWPVQLSAVAFGLDANTGSFLKSAIAGELCYTTDKKQLYLVTSSASGSDARLLPILTGTTVLGTTDNVSNNSTVIGTTTTDALNNLIGSLNTISSSFSSSISILNNTSGENILINGGFAINQRSFSSNNTNGTYIFDRWVNLSNNTISNYTATNKPSGSLASLKMSNTSCVFGQRIESYNAYQMEGKYVTVSFDIYGDSVAEGVDCRMYYANSTDNFSGTTLIGSQVYTTSTVLNKWTRVSATFANIMPTNIRNGAELRISPGRAVIITNIKLEIGTVATTFHSKQYSLEYADCMRYFQQAGSNAYIVFGCTDNNYGDMSSHICLPVKMRAGTITLGSWSISPWDYSTTFPQPDTQTVTLTGENYITITLHYNSYTSPGNAGTIGDGKAIKGYNSTITIDGEL